MTDDHPVIQVLDFLIIWGWVFDYALVWLVVASLYPLPVIAALGLTWLHAADSLSHHDTDGGGGALRPGHAHLGRNGGGYDAPDASPHQELAPRGVRLQPHSGRGLDHAAPPRPVGQLRGRGRR